MSLSAGEECSGWPVSVATSEILTLVSSYLNGCVWDIVSNFQPGDIFIGHFTASYTSLDCSDWT